MGPRDEDNKFDDDLLSMPTNNSNRNDNAGPYDNKYEYMSSMAKHHVDILSSQVSSKAGKGYEEAKKEYERNATKKKSTISKNGATARTKKKLEPIRTKEDDVFFTGAGLQQNEEQEDEEQEDEYKEELKDEVGNLYVVEDQEIDDLMNEMLAEIKQDCLKMHKVV